jgi:hypothetical protein
LVARFVTEDDLQEAQERLRDMSINIERTYGPEFITSNIHLSMHIPECIRDYGSVYSFWLFPYERLNGYIGKPHISGTQIIINKIIVAKRQVTIKEIFKRIIYNRLNDI